MNIDYSKLSEEELIIERDKIIKELEARVVKRYLDSDDNMFPSIANLKKRISKDIEETYKNNLLNLYLNETEISSLFFLDHHLYNPPRGINNEKERINEYKLLQRDIRVRELLANCDINNQSDLISASRNSINNKNYKLLFNNEDFISALNKTKYLISLDEFFRVPNNAFNYQGTFTLYQFFKDYLKEVLVDGVTNPIETVEKDIDIKRLIIMNDFSNISTALYTFKEEVPGSLIAVANSSIKRNTKKSNNNQFTYTQEELIDTIAHGMSIEELEKKEYRRLKKLVFYPIKKK